MTRPDTVAIIVAGGLGRRFGDARGKQYVGLCGRPLVSWSLMAFGQAASVAAVVLVCPGDRMEETRHSVVEPLELHVPIRLACAGPTRQASVAHGLDAAEDLAREREGGFELVAVHDGARPLVTPASIETVIGVVRDTPGLAGAIAAAPVTDTLKQAEAGLIVATPDRRAYWSAMTPQVFHGDVLRSAYEKARAEGYEGTDDASLVEHMGGRVRCVAIPRDNIKVTVPEDLAMAEALLSRRLGHAHDDRRTSSARRGQR